MMRTPRLAVSPALAILLMVGSLPAAAASALEVKVLDDRTVVVRGRGFPEERLLVSADTDMPHASLACYTDYTRVALVSGGNFEVTINPSECDFQCGREPAGYLVDVETLSGATLAEAKFPCVAPRSRPGK